VGDYLLLVCYSLRGARIRIIQDVQTASPRPRIAQHLVTPLLATTPARLCSPIPRGYRVRNETPE